MNIKFTLLLLFVAQFGLAQSSMLRGIIDKIDFKEDTIRSVFDWVTDQIKYDVGKLNDLKNGVQSNKSSEFKTEEAYKQYLLDKVIKQKKGVCEDYALLFDELVKELGYDSYIVEGYTKSDKGKINRTVGHAWNAVKVQEEWKLYDPTWAAGYVEDEKRFIKLYNSKWYEVDAKLMLESHMPYDPIWQILDSPMTYEEFEGNEAAGIDAGNYDYVSIIETYLGSPKKVQMEAQVSRSFEMGEGVGLVKKWRKRITKNIGVYGMTSQSGRLEEANESTSNAVALFNEYVKAKNKQFKGKKSSIEKARQKLKTSGEEVESALEIYNSIEVEDQKSLNSLKKAIRDSERLKTRVAKELKYLEGVGSR